MASNRRGFWLRVVIPPAVLGGAALAATAAFSQPSVSAPPADPVVAASVQVQEQTVALTKGLTCWDDPTRQSPTSAVVKDEGGVTARLVSAEAAWDASARGDVWVLAWCEEVQR